MAVWRPLHQRWHLDNGLFVYLLQRLSSKHLETSPLKAVNVIYDVYSSNHVLKVMPDIVVRCRCNNWIYQLHSTMPSVFDLLHAKLVRVCFMDTSFPWKICKKTFLFFIAEIFKTSSWTILGGFSIMVQNYHSICYAASDSRLNEVALPGRVFLFVLKCIYKHRYSGFNLLSAIFLLSPFSCQKQQRTLDCRSPFMVILSLSLCC